MEQLIQEDTLFASLKSICASLDYSQVPMIPCGEKMNFNTVL